MARESSATVAHRGAATGRSVTSYAVSGTTFPQARRFQGRTDGSRTTDEIALNPATFEDRTDAEIRFGSAHCRVADAGLWPDWKQRLDYSRNARLT